MNWAAAYVSRPFYVLSTLIAQVAGTVLVGGALLAGSGRIEGEFLPVFLLGEAGAIYGLVVLLVLCYKMWAAFPPAATAEEWRRLVQWTDSSPTIRSHA